VSENTSSTDALLFDLGGVIVDIDFRRVFDAWSFRRAVGDIGHTVFD